MSVQIPLNASPRWVALLATLCGLILTGAVGTLVLHEPGVYSSRVEVVFLLPLSAANPNSLQFRSESLIGFAGVVQRTVTASQTGAAPTSDEVTLVGQGIKHGYSVRLPNSGGQWATNFDRPLLDVQVAGSSPAEVSTTMRRVLDAIRTDVAMRQQAAGVQPEHMVSLRVGVGQLPLYYSRGSHLRAVAVSLLLGLGLTVAGASALARVVLRQPPRRHRRTRVAPEPVFV